MTVTNPFRIAGDVCHTLSKCTLIFAIHWNRSAEGVSLITQALYALVFVTRYVDLLWFWLWDFSDMPWLAYWNGVLKVFYIASSLYIILLMMRVFPRTREREKAWKMGAACLVGSVVLTPIMVLIFARGTSFVGVLWSFSEILESVCVLPQLLLLRQTTVPTVIDSYYLLWLGAYRALYIVNWIVRGVDKEDHMGSWHRIAVIFGVLQTLLYLDFAWVYWSRQRVKLRGGGVVDSDDFGSGWLLRLIFARETASVEDGDGVPSSVNGGASHGHKARGRWGVRGISISADDDHVDNANDDDGGHGAGSPTDPSKKPASGRDATADELAGILQEDDDDSDNDGAFQDAPRKGGATAAARRDDGTRTALADSATAAERDEWRR